MNNRSLEDIKKIVDKELRGRETQMTQLNKSVYAKKNILYSTSISFLNKLKMDCKKPGILFTELRYKYVIESLKQKGFRVIVIPSSTDDIKYALEKKLEIYPSFYLWNWILEYYQKKISIGKLYGKVGHELNTMNIQNIIMYKDYPPLQLILTLVSNNLGVQTVIIQHGIYDLKSNYYDGEFADIVLTWGNVWNEHYSKYIPESKLKVIGYPYEISKKRSNSCDDNIIFLNQNFENYFNPNGKDKVEFRTSECEFLDKKLSFIKEIADELNKHSKQLIIKPHPGDEKSQFNNLQLPIFEGNMSECLNKYNIFLSISSTGLLEATLHDKLAIQIQNPKLLDSPDYESYGVCYTISCDDLSKLRSMIYFLPFDVDKNIIDINKNYVGDLINILK